MIEVRSVIWGNMKETEPQGMGKDERNGLIVHGKCFSSPEMNITHRSQILGIVLNVTEPRSSEMGIFHRTQNSGDDVTEPRSPEMSICDRAQIMEMSIIVS
ncbi:hypothetical protein RRG08_006986 [Elysia crispata]|uniref:Uncharacterized protein n=1 Tax=Elysia crispata TaxID=231223 RepID=A0AAE1DTC4_9GAST|nr:hypothetical protein RRG08_006986 [Elysia crispata]